MAGKGGGVTLGFLKFVLGLDGLAFEEGLNLSSKQLKAAQKKFDKTGKEIAGIGKAMSIGITAAFITLAASAIPAATESAQALAQVNAALASMGPVAGKTSADLQKAAGELQHISNFDDDDILKSVTANMLTFGKVTGETFDRAQLATINLSARLGQDLQSSVIQVGKALNDPVKGVTALQRVGVSFTATQREQIAAMVEGGNVAGAQAMILGELEKQFGGAAAAQRAATPNAAMQESWRNFQETVGAIAIKVLPPLTDFLTRVLDKFNSLSPSTQTFVVAAVALVAALGPLLIGVGAIVGAMGTLLPLVVAAPATFAVLSGVISTTVIPTLSALAIASLPLLPWLAALAGAVALVVAAWNHWPEIVKFVKDVYVAAKTYLMEKLDAVWSWLTGKIEVVRKAFYNLYDAVVGNSYIPDMVDGIGDHIARLDVIFVKKSQGIVDEVKEIFRRGAGEIADEFEKMNPGSLVRDRKPADAIVDLDQVGGDIEQFARDMKIDLGNEAESQTARVANSFSDMARSVGGSLQGLSDSIRNGDFLDVVASVVDVIGAVVEAVRTIKSGSSGGSSGYGGARVAGGPVVAGKTYLVGENGPEFMTPGASGFITPNNDNSAGGRIHIVPSPYFNAVVDGRARGVAAPMAASAAVQGSQGAQVAMMRRGARRLA